jgi:hypothetical protein
MDLRVDVSDAYRYAAKMRRGPQIVSEEMGKAGKEVGTLLERLFKAAAAVWRGHLRRSITHKVTVTSLYTTTTVGTNVPYARTRNYGRRPGATPPPTAPIAAWLASKGGDPKRAYVVARAIGRRGIPGDFFITGTFKKSEGQVRAIYRKVPGRVVARLRA